MEKFYREELNYILKEIFKIELILKTIKIENVSYPLLILLKERIQNLFEYLHSLHQEIEEGKEKENKDLIKLRQELFIKILKVKVKIYELSSLN